MSECRERQCTLVYLDSTHTLREPHKGVILQSAMGEELR